MQQRFTDLADWVSDKMGSPLNIVFWFVAVFGWTALYALRPELATVNFLPAWFTSQAYNFPLNLVTTVAELFIGFLCAAASNRVQRTLMELLTSMKDILDHLEAIDTQEDTELKALVAEIHSKLISNPVDS